MACVRQSLLQCFLYLTLISLLLPTPLIATAFPMSLPNCTDKCGDVTIPYPFGFLQNCYGEGFKITCNESTTPPKPILGENIEIIDINIAEGEARVYKRIAYRCYSQLNSTYISNYNAIMNLKNSPFLFSHRRNKFTAIGCNTLAYIEGPPINSVPYMSGCVTFCGDLNSTTGDNGSCNGLGCCQTSIPAGLNYYNIKWGYESNSAWHFNPCMYAVVVEEDSYKFEVQDLSGENFLERTDQRRVQLVLDWAIRKNGTCHNGVEESHYPACLSKNSSCKNTNNGEGYLCQCLHGFEGNPYIPDGCLDIDECKLPDIYRCYGNCRNTEGSYECSCRKGTRGNATIDNCTSNFPLPARVAISFIVGVAVLLGICVLLAWYRQHKGHMKEKEEYNRYYHMMTNHLRVFSKKQIENATDNYSDALVLGTGGQGNVYKGSLENNQVVAIKKAKEVVETQRGEFVNEIILLSQINHKNIVKLLGCCLEVKIPMLVYEFVPNGTLYDLLHEQSSRRSISLGTRLKIALDSAVALDHLHSSLSCSVIHGDVKSSNILLENDYHAKVSDFGASNLVPNDGTQVVKVVQGTRGYLDPEYVATEVLTKKSDVYSFGVVLLELITRTYAIFIDEKNDIQLLASCFVSNASKNKLHELLDRDIVSNNEKVIEILQEASKLTVWCLSVRGEDRPTMRQVVEKLQILVRLHSSQLGPARVQEETETSLGESSYFTPHASAFHSTDCSSVLDSETC